MDRPFRGDAKSLGIAQANASLLLIKEGRSPARPPNVIAVSTPLTNQN